MFALQTTPLCYHLVWELTQCLTAPEQDEYERSYNVARFK
jgi:hypothetical protein